MQREYFESEVLHRKDLHQGAWVSEYPGSFEIDPQVLDFVLSIVSITVCEAFFLVELAL